MSNHGKWSQWSMAVAAMAVCSTPAPLRAATSPAPARFGAASCSAAPAAVATATQVATRPAASGRERVRPVAQVTRNQAADVTFEVRPAASGGVEVAATRGDLQVTKTVQSTGEFVLTLTNARDTVAISVSGQGTTVTRGKSTVALRRNDASPDTDDKARRLLADSRAVLAYRSLAAALIDAEDRSPASMALIVGDAVVGMLTGDVGAARRIAKFLAHRAADNRRPVGMAIDCFTLMEQRMVEAWVDYWSCYGSLYPYSLIFDACGYRWVLQVESYWFSFISCSGFSW
jgi:hypothetical protein